MNPCQTCGKDIYPSNGDTTCRLCRKGIVGFAPGRVIYKTVPFTPMEMKELPDGRHRVGA